MGVWGVILYWVVREGLRASWDDCEKICRRKEKAKRIGWLGRVRVRSDCCGTESRVGRSLQARKVLTFTVGELGNYWRVLSRGIL